MPKTALLIGINYPGSQAELGGCCNDARNVRQYLITQRGYLPEDIVTVVDDEVPGSCTKASLLAAVNAFVEKANTLSADGTPTEVFLSYSGHGSFVYDRNSEEKDGRDEVLVPSDYQKTGFIKDDVIGEILGRLNQQVRGVLLIDACHSGSMCDLPHRYIGGVKTVIENSNHHSIKAQILSLSGCRDNQTSMDVFDFFGKEDVREEYTGAMTSSFLRSMRVLQEGDVPITCFNLLKTIHKLLRAKRLKQRPQLSTTFKIQRSTLFAQQAAQRPPFLS